MKFRWKKFGVVLGMFLGLNVAAITWAEARVDETVRRRGLELGRSLYDASSLMNAFEGERPKGRAGGAHRIVINGAEVALHSGSVRLSPESQLSDLVGRVRRNCRSGRRSGEQDGALMQAPLIEWVGEEEAFIYCLKTDRALTLEAISDMFDAFSKSGDLAHLGTFQGAYFKVSEHKVSILTAEITRGLEPAKMFPTESDAPGTDFAALPRPAGRRALSVGHNENPALNIHQSESDALSNLNSYHGMLLGRGLSVERAPVEDGESLALLARSPNEAFLIVAKDETFGSQLVLARLPD